MQAVSFSEARKRLKFYFDNVFKNHDPLIITRKDNENLVVISLEDYNSLTETNYLLRNEKNRKHLLDSLKNAEKDNTLKYQMIEE